MNFLMKYGLGIIYTLAGIIISLLGITCLYYFDLINDVVFSFLKLFIIIVSVFINCFLIGRKAEKKGYLEGSKFGGIIILLMFLPTIISGNFKLKILLYYVIIMITAILGSMIGISRKKST